MHAYVDSSFLAHFWLPTTKQLQS